MYPFDVPKSYGITFELEMLKSLIFTHSLKTARKIYFPSGCDLLKLNKTFISGITTLLNFIFYVDIAWI